MSGCDVVVASLASTIVSGTFEVAFICNKMS